MTCLRNCNGAGPCSDSTRSSTGFCNSRLARERACKRASLPTSFEDVANALSREGSCRSGGMSDRRDTSFSCRNDSCTSALTA